MLLHVTQVKRLVRELRPGVRISTVYMRALEADVFLGIPPEDKR